MSINDKVVWSEGLFLRPQLFQQQERYFEHVIHRRIASLSPFFWGFDQYEIDRESLALGRFVVRSATGFFQDGTPFNVSIHGTSIVPLIIQPCHLDTTIYLAARLSLPNTHDTVFSGEKHLARFHACEVDLADSNAISQEPKPVQLAQLSLSVLPEEAMSASWIGLPVARIKAIDDAGAIHLHENAHIPPVTAYGASMLLKEWIVHLYDLVRLRAEALAGMLSGTQIQNNFGHEITDYLLLQILNRYEPLLLHACEHSAIPPERLYSLLLLMAGELATFLRPGSRRPDPVVAYDHGDLYLSFNKLVEGIRQDLNQVLIRGAQPIALKEQANNIWTASLSPADLSGYVNMILIAGAQMPSDNLRQQFPAQSKLSAPHRLPELIRSHLPGLVMHPMPLPPRQVPYRASHVYFEILQTGPLWHQVAEQGGLALHIAGHFPGLAMELWGIRKK
jgi:type VI secretion system protein ImpJ